MFTADSPECPRLPPLEFGYHEAAHATALGKILLANMDDEQRLLHLDPEPMPRFGPGTITSHGELVDQLDNVARRGVAWEFGEFQDGATCAAAAVRDTSGALVGSVAVSAPNARFAARPTRGRAGAARHRLPGQPFLPDADGDASVTAVVLACR